MFYDFYVVIIIAYLNTENTYTAVYTSLMINQLGVYREYITYNKFTSYLYLITTMLRVLVCTFSVVKKVITHSFITVICFQVLNKKSSKNNKK